MILLGIFYGKYLYISISLFCKENPQVLKQTYLWIPLFSNRENTWEWVVCIEGCQDVSDTVFQSAFPEAGIANAGGKKKL